MPAVKTHDESLRRRLVDVAGQLLAAEGPASLTLRRLASLSGTSTMAVYTLFGDKQGLLTAMHREGFARLGASLARAHSEGDEPLAALAALGTAYRDAALGNAHLYHLMFGGAVPGFTPDAAGVAAAEATFQPLVQAVQVCLDAGALQGADAERIALHLWAVSHGMVSIELHGRPGAARDAAETYREALVYAATPFLPG